MLIARGRSLTKTFHEAISVFAHLCLFGAENFLCSLWRTSVTAVLLPLIIGRNVQMSIDKNKITTQDDLNEPAPMDQAGERAEAEMKRLEDEAKRDVAEGLEQTDDED
jgi:hypothetical protein